MVIYKEYSENHKITKRKNSYESDDEEKINNNKKNDDSKFKKSIKTENTQTNCAANFIIIIKKDE